MKSHQVFSTLGLVCFFLFFLVLIFGPGIEKNLRMKSQMRASVKAAVKAAKNYGALEASIPKHQFLPVDCKAKDLVAESKVPVNNSSNYVSPEKLAKMALGEILKKHKEEAINAILSDKSLWGRVLEELEIKTAIQIGEEKYPEINEKWGAMITDSMTAKLSDKSLGIPDSISLPALGKSVVGIESQGYLKATSKKKAKGLWQLMANTAKELYASVGKKFPTDQRSIDALLYNPYISTSLGTSHLLRSAKKQHGNVKRMIVAYECGDGAVDSQIRRYHGIDNVPYLRKVWPVYCWILEHENQKSSAPESSLANN
jgi:hypothetical protein